MRLRGRIRFGLYVELGLALKVTIRFKLSVMVRCG